MVANDDLPGRGHNRPPAPVFELRGTGGISCDWVHDKQDRPVRWRHTARYWRIYRDGKLVDSFMTKARALRALRELQRREAGE